MATLGSSIELKDRTSRVLNQVLDRMDRLLSSVDKVEAQTASPIDVAIDAADVVEASMDVDTLSDKIDELSDTMETVEAPNLASPLTAAIEKTEKLEASMSGVESEIEDSESDMKRFNNTLKGSSDGADKLFRTFLRIAGTVAAGLGVNKVIELSDLAASTSSRINNINDGLQTSEALNRKIFVSANKSRAAYQDTADAVYKMAANAGDAFKSNDETIAFVELVNKEFVNAGTSVEGASAAMYQLTQAMGSGVLRGEELNSILEQAPNIVQNIADYMELPKGQIRELAAEGQITAEIVKNAMFAASDEINEKFDSMPMTFAQVVERIKNQALMMFQPVLLKLNELVNSPAFAAAVDNILLFLQYAAIVIMWVVDKAIQGINWIAASWSQIAPILERIITIFLALGAAILIVKTVMAIYSVVTKIAAVATNIFGGAAGAANLKLLGIILIIVAVIALFYLVIFVINKLTGESISATGLIFGAFHVLAAGLWNIFLALADFILGVVNYMINPWLELANFIGNVFTSPVSSVIKLFHGLADNVLGIIERIASGIDFLTGSNLAATVKGWRATLSAVADAAIEKYAPDEDYKEIVGSLDLSMESFGLDRWAYSDAWETGYERGEAVENFDLSDAISNLMDGLKLDTDGFDESDYEDPADWDQDYSIDIDDFDIDPFDWSMAGVDLDGPDLKGIDDNVGDIKDSVEASEENLDYLLDIASRDQINRYSTGNFKFEVTNNNTINNDMDLDGVKSALTEELYDDIYAGVEGVHI